MRAGEAVATHLRGREGVPRIEASEKAHFFRVDIGEWDGIIQEFEDRVGAES